MISELRKSTEVEETPIDWNKRQLVINEKGSCIIQTLGSFNDTDFKGNLVWGDYENMSIEHYKTNYWSKKYFKLLPIDQEVILKNK